MREPIVSWLNGSRNYQEGVNLYLKYGTDRLLRNCFLEPIETPFKQKKLVECLRELLQNCNKEKKIVQEAKEVVTVSGKQWPETTDEILKSLRDRWRPLYGEMTMLQGRLHEVANQGARDPAKKEEARQMAQRILELEEAVYEIYAEKEYYTEHGKLPVAVKAIEENITLEAAYRQKSNLERYLRDLANKLSRSELSDHKRTKWLTKWDALASQLMELNKKLNRATNEGIPERG